MHHDAFDLEAVAAVDRVVVAPRPVTAAVLGRLGPLRALELGDQLADVLRAIARQYQHGIGS